MLRPGRRLLFLARGPRLRAMSGLLVGRFLAVVDERGELVVANDPVLLRAPFLLWTLCNIVQMLVQHDPSFRNLV